MTIPLSRMRSRTSARLDGRGARVTESAPLPTFGPTPPRNVETYAWASTSPFVRSISIEGGLRTEIRFADVATHPTHREEPAGPGEASYPSDREPVRLRRTGE